MDNSDNETAYSTLLQRMKEHSDNHYHGWFIAYQNGKIVCLTSTYDLLVEKIGMMSDVYYGQIGIYNNLRKLLFKQT